MVPSNVTPEIICGNDREFPESTDIGGRAGQAAAEQQSAAARGDVAGQPAELVLAAQRLSSRLAEFLNSRAGTLLIGISVYREPVDGNAVLFQVGEHDWAAARAGDACGPTPPYQAPTDLAELIAASRQLGVLIGHGADPLGSGGSATGLPRTQTGNASWTIFVDNEVAGEVERLLIAAGRGTDLADAHRNAARYWQWRVAAWPQARRSDVHDLLEARQHLFRAGDVDAASELTEVICAQLVARGEYGRAAELIQATLDAMPGPSTRHAGWLRELAKTAQASGDLAAAEYLYQHAVEMFSQVGDAHGMARGHECLGVLAHARGEYRRAERHYRRAAAADQRASSQGDSDTGAPPEAVPFAAIPTAAVPLEAAPTEAGLIEAGLIEAGLIEAGLIEAGLIDTALGAVAPTDAGPVAPPPDAVDVTRPDLALAEPAPAGWSLPAWSAPDAAPRNAAPQRTAPPHATALDATREPAASLVPHGPALGAARSAQAAERRFAAAVSQAIFAGVVAAGPRRGWWRSRTIATVLVIAALGVTAVAVAQLARSAGSAQAARSAGTADAGGIAAARDRMRAAAWITGQVSRSAVVACDPAMCTALSRAGAPAGDLLPVGPGAQSDPLGSDVVVATYALRSELGSRLATVYAPLVIASFGTGSARIEVRVTAPDGAAAYLQALRGDEAARATAGTELIRGGQLGITSAARRALRGGAVDSRTLTTLAAMAHLFRFRVAGFGDAGPGAARGVPLRSAELALTGNQAQAAKMLAFLRAQRAPYLAASISAGRLPGGQPMVRFEFADPSPFGLLTASGSAPPTGNP